MRSLNLLTETWNEKNKRAVNATDNDQCGRVRTHATVSETFFNIQTYNGEHMKRSIKAMLASLGMATVVGVSVPNANADIDWVISPDSNALAFGVTVVNGVAQIGSKAGSVQPAGIFGAGFTMTGSSVYMNFDADLYTWDSYNAPGSTSFSGYRDAFIVTVSTVDFYWNLSNTAPVTSTASTWVWGGKNYGDSIRENYTTAPGNTDTVGLFSATPSIFYVSLVLDTKTFSGGSQKYPSWGSFHVAPAAIPEPETYAMLLSGLGLMGFVMRRFRRNAAA